MVEKTEMVSSKREYDGQAKALWRNKKQFFSFHITKNMVLLNLLAIFLGRATILDGLTPFGLALFSALLVKDKKYSYLGLGVMLGIVTAGQSTHWIRYAVALVLIWGVFIYIREKIRLDVLQTAAVAGILILLSGTLYLGAIGFFLYDFFMIGFESVVVFVFVYIISYAVPVILQKTNRKILSNEELICIAIVTAVLISGFSNVMLGEYSVKNILGILLTLIFAYNGGASVGAGVGVTIGIITSMSNIGTPTIIGIYAFSGLLAGIFKDLGKIGSAIGLVLGNAILTFYINGSTEVFLQFEEIVTAFTLFMVMPKSVMRYMEKYVNPTGGTGQLDKAYSDRIRGITYHRLKEYAHAFSELAITYDQIAEKNRVIDQQEVANIVDQVVSKTCKHCGMCRSCWNNSFYSTYNDIVEIISVLESTGRIQQDRIPQHLKKRCIRLDVLIQTVCDKFEIYKIHYKWQKKLFESRQLVAEQFKGVSDIIYDLATEVCMEVNFKTELEDAIYVAFDKEGLNVDKVTVLENENGKYEVEIEKRACFDRKQCDEKIAPVVSRVVGSEMLRKNHHCTNDEAAGACLFKLVEAEKYRISTGVARVSKDHAYVCGDSYSFIELKDGKHMIALSDGMGAGEKAAKESTTTVTLLEQLMEAGFDKDIAIKTINSILVLKSSEEIFSTIDLSIIDLYTGKLECVKIGAASSFIKRANGEVEVIRSTSLPIGILNNIDIESFGKRLNNGDFVVMVSDGILDADKNLEEKEHWVISALKHINSRNPQFIADELLTMAIKRYGNKLEDDMTVLVSKLWEPK